MAHKLIEDSEYSFKIQRPDGQVVHIAKTPETMPIYKLCKGGAMPGYAQGGILGTVEKLAPLAMMALNDGGPVPGRATVAGDSQKNDTVNAKLSPGELVVPRSVVAQGPQAVAKFAAEALAGKHPAAPSQRLNKGGEESDDDTPSKEDVSDALKTIAKAAGGNDTKTAIGDSKKASDDKPYDDEYQGIDKYISKAVDAIKPYIDTNSSPVNPFDGPKSPPGQMQVDGAPLQSAQTGYDQSGYTTDASATAGPDTGGGMPAQGPQDQSQAPGYNPMAGVPNAAPQQDQAGAPAPLKAAQNQASAAPAVDPNAAATNVDGGGAGHVPPASTGGGATSGGMKPVGENLSSTFNPYLAKSVKDVQAAGDNLVAADTAAAQARNAVDQQRLKAEYETLKTQNEKIAIFEQKRNDAIESRIARMDAVQNKFAGMSIDSNRLYGDGQTSSKILAGIGLSLGAFGQGLAGGPNQALQAIDKAIDRDIEVQKANIGKVGKEYEMARGGLKDYMDASKDMETSMVAEKARQLELVGKQYEQIAAANANPMIKAQAAKTAYMVAQNVAALNEKVGSNTKALIYSSAPLHQEAQLPEEQKTVRDNIQTQIALEGLTNLVNAGTFTPGKVSGNMLKLKKKFGIESASDQDAMMKAQEIALNLAHNLGGARALAPQEFDNIQKLAPNITDDPEGFMKSVNNLYEKVVAQNNLIAKGNADNHRYSYDLEGLKQEAIRGMPQHYQSVIGFKPNAGQRRVK